MRGGLSSRLRMPRRLGLVRTGGARLHVMSGACARRPGGVCVGHGREARARARARQEARVWHMRVGVLVYLRVVEVFVPARHPDVAGMYRFANLGGFGKHRSHWLRWASSPTAPCSPRSPLPARHGRMQISCVRSFAIGDFWSGRMSDPRWHAMPCVAAGCLP